MTLIRQRFGAWVERAGALDAGREVTDEHRGWRMDSTKAGGAGFPWMFDHCVHFFATAEYLMNDSRIKEVYSLGEGGKGPQWPGKDVHLVLHRRNGETETFRFDEGADDIWQSEVSYYSRAHTNQIHEFVGALTSGTKPRYTGVNGWRDIKTTMAAICSAKEGVAVKVSEVTDERFAR